MPDDPARIVTAQSGKDPAILVAAIAEAAEDPGRDADDVPSPADNLAVLAVGPPAECPLAPAASVLRRSSCVLLLWGLESTSSRCLKAGHSRCSSLVDPLAIGLQICKEGVATNDRLFERTGFQRPPNASLSVAEVEDVVGPPHTVVQPEMVLTTGRIRPGGNSAEWHMRSPD